MRISDAFFAKEKINFAKYKRNKQQTHTKLPTYKNLNEIGRRKEHRVKRGKQEKKKQQIVHIGMSCI